MGTAQQHPKSQSRGRMALEFEKEKRKQEKKSPSLKEVIDFSQQPELSPLKAPLPPRIDTQKWGLTEAKPLRGETITFRVVPLVDRGIWCRIRNSPARKAEHFEFGNSKGAVKARRSADGSDPAWFTGSRVEFLLKSKERRSSAAEERPGPGLKTGPGLKKRIAVEDMR